MDLRKLFLTKNECYIANRSIKPVGVMWHSTGANNPNLKRYVGPDDGALGLNTNGNHWNTARPGGRQVCVHAFIGLLANNRVATYQTLPWDIEGWHSGSGSKGSANKLGYIGFEICEDGLQDAEYFAKVYQEAVELTAMLCQRYGLDPRKDGVVICHSEGYKRGIASNHADVMHWFPKHGKSMDTARADVAKLLKTQVVVPPAFSPYVIKINNVNVRKDATTSSTLVGTTGVGSFTIVEEKNGWGKLKSGMGWVKLDWSDKPNAEIELGDIVNFKGGKHYTSSTGTTGYAVKAGQAKVTGKNKGAKHPFHIISINTKVTNVYGWVDAATISKV